MDTGTNFVEFACTHCNSHLFYLQHGQTTCFGCMQVVDQPADPPEGYNFFKLLRYVPLRERHGLLHSTTPGG